MCSVCGLDRPIDEFYRRTASRDGLRAECKACADKRTSPEYKRNRYYLKTYGITAAEFDELWIKQQGRCFLCHNPADHPHLDHSHKTGKVRALLCHNCNVGLGHFMDDPDLLVRAAQYIRAFDKE